MKNFNSNIVSDYIINKTLGISDKKILMGKIKIFYLNKFF